MGKYLSPPSLDGVRTKCAIIFYPEDDGAFFSSALRGQLSELCRPYIWEGGIEFTKQISQLWIETDLLTDDVFWRTDCDFVKLITGDEEMNINVNVNCGCCDGSSGDTLICYDKYGNPVLPPESEPIEQNNPTGGDWPMQPATDDPPADFDAWSDYDENACAAANNYYKLWIWILTAVYGILGLAEQVAQAILLLAAFFPARVAEVLSSRFLANMAEALLSLAEKSEDAQAWLGTALEYAEANQETLVCILYSNRHNIPAMRVSFLGNILQYVVDTLAMSGTNEGYLTDFLYTTAPTNVLFKWFIEAGVYANLVAEPIDCANCAIDEELDWQIYGEGEYCVAEPITIGVYIPDGEWNGGGLDYAGQVSKDSQYGAYAPNFRIESATELTRYSGMVITIHNTNQDQDHTVYMRIHYDDSTSDVVQYVDPGDTGDVDATGKTVVGVEVGVDVGVYALPCPQEVSGDFRITVAEA